MQIPGYLKRFQIVTTSGPNELRLAEFERLDDNIARVLAEDIGEYLKTNRIGLFP